LIGKSSDGGNAHLQREILYDKPCNLEITVRNLSDMEFEVWKFDAEG
jgi:hypothetical protein